MFKSLGLLAIKQHHHHVWLLQELWSPPLTVDTFFVTVDLSSRSSATLWVHVPLIISSHISGNVFFYLINWGWIASKNCLLVTLLQLYLQSLLNLGYWSDNIPVITNVLLPLAQLMTQHPLLGHDISFEVRIWLCDISWATQVLVNSGVRSQRGNVFPKKIKLQPFILL